MTRNTNDQEVTTQPLALRLRTWALARVMRYMASGQLDKHAALMALEADESYYLAPTTEDYAAMVWRKMVAALSKKNMPDAERSYVVTLFCDDVLNEGWDSSFLDRAYDAWRMLGKEFIPTAGQLLRVANEAKLQSGRFHLQALRRVIDPPRIVANLDAPKASEPRDESMTLAQTIERIDLMQAQKDANSVERNGKAREWGKVDEMFLSGLKARRASFEGATA